MMKPKIIRFSHNYPKLHGQRLATLLAVFPIRINRNTPKELIEYDTTYDGGKYPLPTGNYIQLIFIGDARIPFCTIRKVYPPSKVDYYKDSVGELFVIELKEEVTK